MVVWKNPPTYGWNTCKISLGKNEEILDGELGGILKALKIALKESINKKIRKVTVFLDFQTALKQLQNVKSNAGQALKIQIFRQARKLHKQDRKIVLRLKGMNKPIKQLKMPLQMKEVRRYGEALWPM